MAAHEQHLARVTLARFRSIRQAGVVSFAFSSRTIGKLIRDIDAAYTDARIGTLLLEAGDRVHHRPGGGGRLRPPIVRTGRR